MSSQAMRVSPRTGTRDFARAQIIRRELDRFRPEIRPAVIALASRHVRLAELSVSFPALLIALAWPRAGFDPRLEIAHVIAGMPLPLLAARAKLPLWLRRMKPEALIAPLPQLPDSPFIRHRIGNRFPHHHKHAPAWFDMLSLAGHWVHDEFALWCAQECAKRVSRRFLCEKHLLCLWAWHSGQPGTPGHAQIAVPWTPAMQLRAAHDAALRWREAVDLELHLGGRLLDDLWYAPAVVDGYSFVPLRHAAEIREEAEAMGNCLQTYGENVAHGASRIWSLRKDGARVATMEIVRAGRNPLPVIEQLLLARNQDAPMALWLTAHKWLAGQAPHLFDAPSVDWNAVRPDLRIWQSFWKPFWMAKRRIPAWLPLVPTRFTLFDI